MKKYLKVKSKSLAAEANIIRLEEQRARASQKEVHDEFWKLRMGLQEHRRFVVRPARRSAHLAWCFLKGTPYRKAESFCYQDPDWKAIEKMILRYGEDDSRSLQQRFEEWKQE